MKLSLAAFVAVGALVVAGEGGGAHAQLAPGSEACSDEAILARDTSIPVSLPIAPAWGPADNPAVATHYAARAKDYARCGLMPKALANFAIALELDASNLLIYVNRGDAYAKAGQPADAIRDYSTAISLNDPQRPSRYLRSVYASRAEAYAATGDFTNALADLNKVLDELKALPTDGMTATLAEYRFRRAVAYFNQGDIGHAQTEFSALSSQTPSDWAPLAWLGRTRLRAGDVAGAITALTAANDKLTAKGGADQAPQRALIQASLGQAYAKRAGAGDVPLARKAYRAALGLDPSNADATQGLAALPPTPMAPTFADEPSLPPIPLPEQIHDLFHDWPGPFCSGDDKNAYLDRVKLLSDVVQANINTLTVYTAKIDAQRAQYDASDLLGYDEKVADLTLFDAEHHKLAVMQADQARQGTDLRNFFIRVAHEGRLVVGCDKDGAPFRHPTLPVPKVAPAVAAPVAVAAPAVPTQAAAAAPPPPSPPPASPPPTPPVAATQASATPARSPPPPPAKPAAARGQAASASGPTPPASSPPSKPAGSYQTAADAPKPPPSAPPSHKPTRREVQQAAARAAAGQALIDQGQYERAVQPLTEAHQLNPANADITAALALSQGYVALAQRNLDVAAADFNAANAAHASGLAWNGLGLVAAARGATTDAISAFERAVALSPKLAEAQVNRGDVYLTLAARDPTQYKTAIAAYTAALVANGGADYPIAFLHRGQAGFYDGVYQDALRDFGIALAQNHLLADALYGIARAQIEQGQYGEAITAAGEHMQLHEPDAADFCTRGLAFYLRGRETRTKTDLQAALTDFQQAKTLQPANPDIARRVSETQKLAGGSQRSISPFVRRPGPSTTASLAPDAACRL